MIYIRMNLLFWLQLLVKGSKIFGVIVWAQVTLKFLDELPKQFLQKFLLKSLIWSRVFED